VVTSAFVVVVEATVVVVVGTVVVVGEGCVVVVVVAREVDVEEVVESAASPGLHAATATMRPMRARFIVLQPRPALE
jgi:hypothetical protein